MWDVCLHGCTATFRLRSPTALLHHRVSAKVRRKGTGRESVPHATPAAHRKHKSHSLLLSSTLTTAHFDTRAYYYVSLWQQQTNCLQPRISTRNVESQASIMEAKMEQLKEKLPSGMADAAVGIPGVGAVAQLLLNKLGFDVGNTMSLYLLLFGLYQGVMWIYTQGRGYLL